MRKVAVISPVAVAALLSGTVRCVLPAAAAWGTLPSSDTPTDAASRPETAL